ncbi:MAG: GmrSD restriction endonuclease domain-containing protein [Propionibacteriaceae bacterium]
METFKRTPLQLFNLPQHFVIPLFQRPYVWKEAEQWEPLWKDIRRVAELRINEPHVNPQHFLGAIVLQAHDAGSNRVTTWNVIDGQQRLTTLQLLMDATSAVLTQSGSERFASQLESLTHNSANFIPEGESQLKLRHLNNDHGPFDEVMTAEAPIDHSSLRHSESKIVHAHQYFTTAVMQWLGDPDTGDHQRKAEQLATVLQADLQLVTIELLASENSQEIFETLNARGTPLTAADLVRNFVFQRLEAEGGDTKKAYKEDWPFETKFWAKEISVGRNFVSRSSLFLNQWLTSRMGEEISPQSTFTRFKSYVEHEAGRQMAHLLPVLKAQAQSYEAWTLTAAQPSGNLSAVEMAVYRMQAGGIELLKPLLLWLHEPGRNIPSEAVNRIVAAAESWVIRRQLLRLTGSDLGRIVADIIRTYSHTPPTELADRVIEHLARLNVSSTYWPGDDEIRTALLTEKAYRRFPRPRLRSFLEAIENFYRAETGQPQVERAGFPIEHILPQKWQDTWPVDSAENEQERQERVHHLGNLTLLTTNLNSKVSNGPWSSKRAALLQHNTIKLTGRLVEETQDREWDEDLIDRRTSQLVETLLKVWPVPDGHQGKVVDPQTKAQDWVELKHLIEAGFLERGQKLVATHRAFVGTEAVLGEDTRIHIDGKAYGTPSGAAMHLRKRPTNGWYFWSVSDGRRLRDVRAEFLAAG